MMKTVADLLYAESHEWVKIENDEAVIGITDYAQHSLGDITYVDMPAVGDSFTKKQEMASIESVKAASEIYMPFDATVIAVNEDLDENPSLINGDPYGKGWILRVKINSAPEGLLSAAEYEAKCSD